MEIKRIQENKTDYMDLLLLGDEQENMINKYLYRGELYALYDGDLKTVCVVTKEDEFFPEPHKLLNHSNNKIYEIKNIATYEKFQGRGYGKIMIQYIIENYENKCHTLLVGTGESKRTISFYKKCGFKYSHTEKDFFVKNYDHEIIEEGNQLVDMIYLKIEFNQSTTQPYFPTALGA